MDGDCFSFHFEEVDGAGWRMILLPIRPKLASLSEERRAFGSVIGASQISLSRPHVLNLRRYTRTSPERVQNESRTKIKIKMMNRSMSEAPSQQIIVTVTVCSYTSVQYQ